MAFKVGDKVLVKERASADSIILYKNYSRKYPYLIGPCSVPTTQVLIIKCLIGTTGALVQYENNELKLSMFKNKDLKKVIS